MPTIYPYTYILVYPTYHTSRYSPSEEGEAALAAKQCWLQCLGGCGSDPGL